MMLNNYTLKSLTLVSTEYHFLQLMASEIYPRQKQLHLTTNALANIHSLNFTVSKTEPTQEY